MRELPSRKRIRLDGYDYSSAGCYFITICIKDKHELLGEVVGAGFARPYCKLSPYGVIVRDAIECLHEKYSEISTDKYVIMPNHIHLILVINGRADPAPTIGQIMGYFKYKTTKEVDIQGFWQRSYHDHIIRNEEDYLKIWEYIDTNPLRWAEDCYHA